LVAAQDTEVKFIIDSFDDTSPTLIVVTDAGGVPANGQSNENFVTGSTIFGGERDLQLEALTGVENLVLSSVITDSTFSASTPNGATGQTLLQLDGVDGTIILNPSGTFGSANSNFLQNGGDTLHFVAQTDQTTTIDIRIYSGSANSVCTASLTVQGGDQQREFTVPFSSFSSGCDFTRVGAFEFEVTMNNAVDIVITQIDVSGPVAVCQCFCPAYTCAIQFDNSISFYYNSSDFRPSVGTFNPTTDLSTVNTNSNPQQPSNTNVSSASALAFSALLFACIAALF